MVLLPRRRFSGPTTDITLKNYQAWDCPVYVLDVIFQGEISGLPKCGPHSHAGIYFGHSSFNAVSVALVINPATGHVSHQFHLVLDDVFSTVLLMR